MTLVNLDESTGEIAPVYVEATPAEQVAQFTEWADALMGVGVVLRGQCCPHESVN